MHAKKAQLDTIYFFKSKKGFCTVRERLCHFSCIHKPEINKGKQNVICFNAKEKKHPSLIFHMNYANWVISPYGTLFLATKQSVLVVVVLLCECQQIAPQALLLVCTSLKSRMKELELSFFYSHQQLCCIALLLLTVFVPKVSPAGEGEM